MAIARYRDEIVATAQALFVQGYSLRRIETELADRFPGEPAPDHTTISRWMVDPILQRRMGEALEPQETRIAHLAGRILEEHLEQIERGEREISPAQAGILYGISRSKLFERANLRQRMQPQVNFYAVIQRHIGSQNPECRDGSAALPTVEPRGE